MPSHPAPPASSTGRSPPFRNWIPGQCGYWYLRKGRRRREKAGTPEPPEDNSFWVKSGGNWETDIYTPNQRRRLQNSSNKEKTVKEVLGIDPKLSSLDLLVNFFQEDDVHVQMFLPNHAGVTHETLSSIIRHWLYSHKGPTKRSRKSILKELGVIRRNLESAGGLFGSGAGYDREVQFMKDNKLCTKYIKDISDAEATAEEICPHFKDWDVILRDVRPLDATLRNQSQRNQNVMQEHLDMYVVLLEEINQQVEGRKFGVYA
ncbi:hypothetical protein L202_01008 [Cryptococcus amylolentus CBS 6039]|uniref:Uncharacterized protein n=1 Tax=Cryptococcus amylolentus CBS 6039 TaxID=1295533 RepID=A0A1E3I261_9TREE|nr:hypothetical protein L202_01008 [Cryptococcus amylolentus CBS 6039]ODN82723.1 hypothetical protein L202_01008 [Cryptococcus amylolentus CBS 6039]